MRFDLGKFYCKILQLTIFMLTVFRVNLFNSHSTHSEISTIIDKKSCNILGKYCFVLFSVSINEHIFLKSENMLLNAFSIMH